MIEYWPGTDIPKSTNNAFTHGWGDTPHGYEPGPASATVVKIPKRKPGGFAKNNGTLHGLAIRPNAMTLRKRA